MWVYHRFGSPDAPTPSMRALNLRFCTHESGALLTRLAETATTSVPMACGLIEIGAARTRACRLCWSGCWLCRFPRSRSLLTPARGMSLRETLHAFPGPLKTEHRSDTLEEVRGGVDLHCGVLGALGNSLTLHGNTFEHDAYRGHSHSSSLVLGRCGDIAFPRTCPAP